MNSICMNTSLRAISGLPARGRRALRGFTLIELVVAMVVSAILLAIAIPSYQSYVLKSHRTDAKSALLDLASMEERYFSTNNVYSQLPTDLGYGTAAFPIPSVGSGYYSVNQTVFTPAAPPSAASPAGTPAYYQFTATAIGNQVKDTACLTFTVDSTGVQTSAPSATGCW